MVDKIQNAAYTILGVNLLIENFGIMKLYI